MPAHAQPPRYFLDSSATVDGDAVVIAGALAHRLGRVMRVRPGDALELVDKAGGRLLSAAVSDISHDAVRCIVTARRPLQPLTGPRIVLSAALIRPQRFDIIAEKATELGVHEIRPVRAQRSASRAESEPRLARWRRIALEAAEQSRREDVPMLHDVKDAVELIRTPQESGELRLLTSPGESGRRVADTLGDAEPNYIHILVGPEGGFTPQEERLADEHRWTPVTLGDRTLRAETAAIVAVALTVDALR